MPVRVGVQPACRRPLAVRALPNDGSALHTCTVFFLTPSAAELLSLRGCRRSTWRSKVKSHHGVAFSFSYFVSLFLRSLFSPIEWVFAFQVLAWQRCRHGGRDQPPGSRVDVCLVSIDSIWAMS